MVNNKGYLNEQVYFSLRKKILRGFLKPGERLIETKISEEFDISRTPVREALNRLKQEGLIYNSNAGLFVSELSIDDIEDIFGLRKVLEYYSIELAVEKINHAQIIRLEGLLKEAEVYLRDDFFDLDKILEINTKFHNMIYEISGNKKLKKIIGDLQDSILRYRTVTLHNKQEAKKAINRHKKILKALKEGDKKKGGKCVVDDVMQAKRAILELFEEKELNRGNKL